jgi:hypothetical protein
VIDIVEQGCEFGQADAEFVFLVGLPQGRVLGSEDFSDVVVFLVGVLAQKTFFYQQTVHGFEIRLI